MNTEAPSINSLLQCARAGDEAARHQLLELFRQRLRRMVAVRLDPRLTPRLDASDIVQESLAEAALKLDAYLAEPPLPFYPWLHRLACERLADNHRRHLRAAKRSAERELPPRPDASTGHLARFLVASDTTPSGRLQRDERHRRILGLLERLTDKDRKVLVMRYLDGLSFAEIACLLDTTEGAVKVRHFRAIERLRDELGPSGDEFN